MKLLVTGGEGLLGSEFAALGSSAREGARAAGGSGSRDVDGAGAEVDVVALGRAELDVTDADEARAVVGAEAPDWVIHCAAYTAVDRAETEAEAAMRVNHGGTVNVAAAAARAGSGLVYLSTDYVFDGRKGTPYLPDDEVAPLSVYARTKRAGEEVALAAGGVVARTGWLYGAGGRNFVEAILERAEAGESLRVVDDQRGRPTWARNVARTVVELLGAAGTGGDGEARGSGGDARVDLAGVWHVADAGDATWLELAREAVGLRGLDVKIEGVSTESWGAAAPRPAWSVLDLRATEARLGRPMMEWRAALAEYLGSPEEPREESE